MQLFQFCQILRYKICKICTFINPLTNAWRQNAIYTVLIHHVIQFHLPYVDKFVELIYALFSEILELEKVVIAEVALKVIHCN